MNRPKTEKNWKATSTVLKWTPGIRINKSNKSKVKNPAN